jgi:multiple sugar transport system permease protein
MAANTENSPLSLMDQNALYMRRRHKTMNLLGSIGKHVMLVLFGLLFVLPLYWMVSSALKPNTEMFTLPPTWVPTQLLWQRFSDAFTFIPFALYTGNSLYIAIYNVVASVVSCLIVAYGFSCLEWKGRDAIFFLVLATLMLPFQVTLIPQYVIFSKLHWVGTFLPLTLPAWFGSPFLIFLLRQFMMTIPKDLLDAANIDGANDLQILWWIITPLTRPALATVAIFTFMGNWNDFFWPLIFLTDAHKFTLPLGLYNFIGSVARTEWGLLLAASTMMTIPPVILFFFAQKTFIQGITLTGIKG